MSNNTTKLEELDRESKYKIFTGKTNIFITLILTAWAVFQLYASLSNKVPLQILRYTHLGLAISMAFILYPATKNPIVINLHGTTVF